MRSDERRSSRDIERELDATRARIDERARELQETLSPGQLLDHTLRQLRSSGARDFFANLGRSVRDNPLPVTLTAVGIAWLASTAGHDEAELPGDDEPHGNGHGRVSRLKERMGGAASSAADAARSGMERARARGRELRARGSRMGRRARGGARSVQSGFERLLEDHPLVLGMLGIAAGALLGSSLPPTETEDEWLGEASDDAKARAAERTREGAERARREVESRAARHAEDGAHTRGSRAEDVARASSAPGQGEIGFGSIAPDEEPGESGHGGT